MMPLPPFEYHAPSSIAGVLELLERYRGQVKLIAGGTDLMPSMKQRLFTPAHLVGLKAVPELTGVREESGHLIIGAMTTIAQVAAHQRVNALLPSLARAASLIAGPQLREMGTLGGNVALDTRCVYYNQTYFWRKALGYCLKKDGTVCHVVKGGQNCVAAASNDTAPVLMTLDASVRLVSSVGERLVKLTDFFVADGMANTVLQPGELIVDVRVPVPSARLVMGYQKLRIRAAIDYPALSVAVSALLKEDKTAEWVRVVVSALGSKPHAVKRLEPFYGRVLDEKTCGEIGEAARKQCHPLTNINVDPLWRRQVIPVFVRRAFASARASAQ